MHAHAYAHEYTHKDAHESIAYALHSTTLLGEVVQNMISQLA